MCALIAREVHREDARPHLQHEINAVAVLCCGDVRKALLDEVVAGSVAHALHHMAAQLQCQLHLLLDAAQVLHHSERDVSSSSYLLLISGGLHGK
jgi:hypothetical protein